MATRTSLAAPSLNVYQKISVIRRPEDSLTYEDNEGTLKSVSIQELGNAIASATPLVAPKPKLDIPVPQIDDVATYGQDVSATFQPSMAYVRYHRRSTHDDVEWFQNMDNNYSDEFVDYVVDAEDENWLMKNSKFGGAVLPVKRASIPKSRPPLIEDRTTATYITTDTMSLTKPLNKSHQNAEDSVILPPQLTLALFERMMDILEKATGFNTIISTNQAETLLPGKIAELSRLFPYHHKIRQAGVASSGTGSTAVVSLKQVILEVYNYWVQKRSKLKRPLLRQFWPVTSSDDTNPHLVFRPREKEKYKLRKKRQNDMDAFRRMTALRNDFENLRAVLELVRHREQLYRTTVQLQVTTFQQRLFELVDTSGLPFTSNLVKREDVKRALNVPTYFDVTAGGKKVKRLRKSESDLSGSRSTAGANGSMASSSPESRDLARKTAESVAAKHAAGYNHGEPAPLFVHALYSRERYTLSWEGAAPHVATYIDSHPMPTFRFRHRPRVGRGGRLCIDRLPLTVSSQEAPLTVLRAGRPLQTSLQPKQTLLDLMPQPLNHTELSRRIEEISLAAISEDADARNMAAPGEPDENDGDELIVKLDDWIETDDQLWGEERFAIGPF